MSGAATACHTKTKQNYCRKCLNTKIKQQRKWLQRPEELVAELISLVLAVSAVHGRTEIPHQPEEVLGFGLVFCFFVCFFVLICFSEGTIFTWFNPRKHNLHLILLTTLHNKRDLSINRHRLLKIHIGRGPMTRPCTPKDRCLYHDRGLYDQAGVQAKVWEYLTLTNRFLPCLS